MCKYGHSEEHHELTSKEGITVNERHECNYWFGCKCRRFKLR